MINVYAVTLSVIPLVGYNRFSSNKKCLFTFVNQYSYLISLSTIILTFVFSTAVIYILIGRTAVQQMRKISDATFVPQEVNGNRRENNPPNMAALKVNIKAINNLTIVVGAFAICSIPYSIYLLLVSKKIDSRDDISTTVDIVRVIVLSLLVVNSAINPVIYALKFPLFAKSFRKLLLREDQSTTQT